MNGLDQLENAVSRMRSGDRSAAWSALDALATVLQESAIDLPYPPTVNSFWQTRVVSAPKRKPFVHTYISKAGKLFKKSVMTHASHRIQRVDGNAAIAINLNPPDHRQRDVDNTIKPLLDSLTDAGAWANDDQVKLMLVRMGTVVSGGKTSVAMAGIGKVQGSLI